MGNYIVMVTNGIVSSYLALFWKYTSICWKRDFRKISL